MKFTTLSLVLFVCFISSCSQSSGEDEARQLKNTIYMRMLNCVTITDQDDVNSLINNKYLEINNHKFSINPKVAGNSFIGRSSSGKMAICSPVQVNIKAEKQVTDYKQIYFSLSLSDKDLLMELSNDYSTKDKLSMFNDKSAVAIFTKVDGNYKLKSVDGSQLDIDDTLKIYNNDYIHNNDTENAGAFLTEYLPHIYFQRYQ